MIARAFPNLAALIAMGWWLFVVDDITSLQPEPASSQVFLTIFFAVVAWGAARLVVAWWERS